MSLSTQDIEILIRGAFPEADIRVQSPDGHHFSAEVVDESFRSMSRVAQQRAVNATVKTYIDSGELHALALTTRAPLSE